MLPHAAVFPEPVCALIRRSFPSRARGMAFSCRWGSKWHSCSGMQLPDRRTQEGLETSPCLNECGSIPSQFCNCLRKRRKEMHSNSTSLRIQETPSIATNLQQPVVQPEVAEQNSLLRSAPTHGTTWAVRTNWKRRPFHSEL